MLKQRNTYWTRTIGHNGSLALSRQVQNDANDGDDNDKLMMLINITN